MSELQKLSQKVENLIDLIADVSGASVRESLKSKLGETITAKEAITLGLDYGMSFKALRELHDTIRMEALSKIAQGLTPMIDIVEGFNGGKLKDSWLKPVPVRKIGVCH